MSEVELLVKKNISFNIKTKRKLLGLTQAQLGKRINIDQRQVAYLEGGNSMPSLKTLCKLVEIFDCQLYELFIFKTNIEEKKQLIAEIRNAIDRSYVEDLKLLNKILKVINTYE